MQADLDVKKRQLFWETPRGLATVVAATAVIVGTIAGVLGFKIGQTPPAPPAQVIFQPGSIVVQPVPASKG